MGEGDGWSVSKCVHGERKSVRAEQKCYLLRLRLAHNTKAKWDLMNLNDDEYISVVHSSSFCVPMQATVRLDRVLLM